MTMELNHYGDDEGTARRAAQREIPDLGKKIVKAVRENQKRYRVIDRQDAIGYGHDLSEILYGYAVADFRPYFGTTPEIISFGNDFDLLLEFADQLNTRGVIALDQ